MDCSNEAMELSEVQVADWKLEEVPASVSGLTGWNLNKFPVPPNCIDVYVSENLVMKGAQCTHFGNYGTAIGGDFDGDGYLDLLQTKLDGESRLLRNTMEEYLSGVSDHEQTIFTDVTELLFPDSSVQLPSEITMGYFLDVDYDGGLDLLVASRERMFLFMYCSESGTYCKEEAWGRGLSLKTPYAHNIVTISAGDIDNDGLMDIYIGEWMTDANKDAVHSVSHARLFHHVTVKGQKGYFEDITATSGVHPENLVERSFFDMPLGVYTLSSSIIDMDNDGLRDIVLSIDFGMSTVYWNNGDLTFTEQTIDFNSKESIAREENGMGLTFHDFNKDGLMDVIFTSIYDERQVGKRCVGDLACNTGWSGNRLFLNEGGRVFADYTDHYGIRKTDWGWSVEVADLDNSGIPEILIVNGFEDASTTQTNLFASSPNTLFVAKPIPGAQPPFDYTYENQGPMRGYDSLAKTQGIAILDVDNDGDLDVVNGQNIGPMLLYLNNYNEISQHQCQRNHFLRVKVESKAGTPLFGASILVWEKDFSSEQEQEERGIYHTAQWQEIGATIGHFSSESEMVAHFGVGSASSIDRVRVQFQGEVLDFLNVPTDSLLVVQIDVDSPPNNEQIRTHDLRQYSMLCPSSFAGFGHASSKKPAEALLHLNVSPTSLLSNPDLRIYFGNVAKEEDIEDLNQYPQYQEPESSALHRFIHLAVQRYKEGQPFPNYAHNGKGNNLKHPEWDNPGWLWRKLPAAYEDGMNLPSGKNRASPRLISNELADQTFSTPSSTNVSTLALDWGQFLAHDLTLANPLVNMKSSSGFPIPVPQGDLWFDPDNTGTATIRFTRTNYNTETGTDVSNPRQQINRQTPFIDGSNVYGNHGVRAADLREHKGGRMRISEEKFIPQTNSNQDCDNPLGRQRGTLFLAGDHRANEQPGLFAVHTVLIREHNRVAELIEKEYPELTDDEIYQIARTIIIVELQIITYNEYLPALLGEGSSYLPQCDAYNEDVRADVFNAFATAAFRFGHSGVPVALHLLEPKDEDSTDYTELRSYDLHHTYFRPEFIRKHGVEPFLLGQSYCSSEEIDMKFVTDLRNLLFGTVNTGGMDLCSLNIQRGRDHGLPDYNTARRYYNLPPVSSFMELAGNDVRIASILEILYTSIEDVDLLVGGLLEAHPEGSSLGELFSVMIKDQFEHLCQGDRFFYKWILERDLREELERELTLSSVIRHNTKLRLDHNEKVFRSKRVC